MTSPESLGVNEVTDLITCCWCFTVGAQLSESVRLSRSEPPHRPQTPAGKRQVRRRRKRRMERPKHLSMNTETVSYQCCQPPIWSLNLTFDFLQLEILDSKSHLCNLDIYISYFNVQRTFQRQFWFTTNGLTNMLTTCSGVKPSSEFTWQQTAALFVKKQTIYHHHLSIITCTPASKGKKVKKET